MKHAEKIWAVLKAFGGFVVGATGVFGWLNVTPEMVGQAAYDALYVAWPLIMFAGGVLSGWGATSIYYKKRIAAKDVEVEELEKQVRASKFYTDGLAATGRKTLTERDDDFVTFSEMDYDARCALYAIDLAGGSMTLWPDDGVDFEMAVSSLDETDRKRVRGLRMTLGMLYDFEFLRCESAPSKFVIYHLTDSAKRVLDKDASMRERAMDDSVRMLDFLTRVSSSLVPIGSDDGIA